MSRIALERIARTLEDYPDNQRAYYLGAGAYENIGDWVTAQQWIEKALSLNPSDPATLYNAACFYARTGETELSLDLLENSLSSRAWLENDPDLDSLREHPRYKALLKTLRH